MKFLQNFSLLIAFHLASACTPSTKMSAGVEADTRSENSIVNNAGGGETQYGSADSKSIPATPSTSETVLVAKPDHEGVSVPSVITGTLLTCQTFEANMKVEVQVSCRYENALGMRVPLSAIAAKQDFSFEGSLSPGIMVSLSNSNPQYEVTFALTGAKFNVLLDAANALLFKVQLSGLANGERDLILSGLGRNIARPPEKRWVREIKSDTNGNGICDADEACIYQGNGYMWLRDDGLLGTMRESQDRCSKRTEGYDDWILTIDTVMQVAAEKGIDQLGDATQLNLADSLYWSLVALRRGDTDPISIIQTVNMRTGGLSETPEDNRLRSICVRALESAVP